MRERAKGDGQFNSGTRVRPLGGSLSHYHAIGAMPGPPQEDPRALPFGGGIRLSLGRAPPLRPPAHSLTCSLALLLPVISPQTMQRPVRHPQLPRPSSSRKTFHVSSSFRAAMSATRVPQSFRTLALRPAPRAHRSSPPFIRVSLFLSLPSLLPLSSLAFSASIDLLPARVCVSHRVDFALPRPSFAVVRRFFRSRVSSATLLPFPFLRCPVRPTPPNASAPAPPRIPPTPFFPFPVAPAFSAACPASCSFCRGLFEPRARKRWAPGGWHQKRAYPRPRKANGWREEKRRKRGSRPSTNENGPLRCCCVRLATLGRLTPERLRDLYERPRSHPLAIPRARCAAQCAAIEVAFIATRNACFERTIRGSGGAFLRRRICPHQRLLYDPNASGPSS